MATSIENMMKKTIKNSSQFNHYYYKEKAVCNQFVFAVDGWLYGAEDPKPMVCRIVPKIYWEKKKQFFTQEIALSTFLGVNSYDLNGTGNWVLRDFSNDPIECIKQLVEKGFVWSQSLQEMLNSDHGDDVIGCNVTNFSSVPATEIITDVDKPITPEFDLEIFERRLGLPKDGIDSAMLNFYKVIRTSPITKEDTIVKFLEKYSVQLDAQIDNYKKQVKIVPVVCWLGKSKVLEHYIEDVPKNTIDEYGRSLLQIAQDYNNKKCEEILLKNGFSKESSKMKMK